MWRNQKRDAASRVSSLISRSLRLFGHACDCIHMNDVFRTAVQLLFRKAQIHKNLRYVFFSRSSSFRSHKHLYELTSSLEWVDTARNFVHFGFWSTSFDTSLCNPCHIGSFQIWTYFFQNVTITLPDQIIARVSAKQVCIILQFCFCKIGIIVNSKKVICHKPFARHCI